MEERIKLPTRSLVLSDFSQKGLAGLCHTRGPDGWAVARSLLPVSANTPFRCREGHLMRSGYCIYGISRVFVLAALGTVPGSVVAGAPDKLPARDDFESKFALNWETIRPDPTHLSLDSHPGKLTITTQYGSIHQAQTTARTSCSLMSRKG